jgi:hypothetical protein
MTLLLLAGCASLPPSEVQSFSTSVSAARNQTSLAFQGVTDLTSQSIIDYAAAQPTLTDANFLPVLPPDAVATWDATFRALQQYSQNLVLLTSPNLTKGYEDAVVSLAAQMKQTGDELHSLHVVSAEPTLSPSLAAAFTELSSLLLRAKAQHSARSIVIQSDPAVRQIFTAMAGAIGDTERTALRGTVNAHWEQNKAKLKVAFLSATPEERHSLAAQYAGLLSSEITQDLALASLQRSLLALASAHHALANGRSAALAAAISAVEQEVQHTYDLFNRFQKLTPGSPSN